MNGDSHSSSTLSPANQVCWNVRHSMTLAWEKLDQRPGNSETQMSILIFMATYRYIHIFVTVGVVARFGFRFALKFDRQSGTPLPRCLSKFWVIRSLQHPFTRLRDFTRFGGKASYHLLNRDHGCLFSLSPVVGIYLVVFLTPVHRVRRCRLVGNALMPWIYILSLVIIYNHFVRV